MRRASILGPVGPGKLLEEILLQMLRDAHARIAYFQQVIFQPNGYHPARWGKFYGVGKQVFQYPFKLIGNDAGIYRLFRVVIVYLSPFPAGPRPLYSSLID